MKTKFLTGLSNCIKSLLGYKIYTEEEVKIRCHSFYLQGISNAAGHKAAKLKGEDLENFGILWDEYEKDIQNRMKKRKSG